MRIIVVTGIVAAVAALTVACSGSTADPTDEGQTSAQDLSSTAKKHCAAGEKKCTVQKSDGSCVDKCVPDEVLCIAPPACGPICDPVGGQPHPGCTWSTTTCKWECPVCDPPPPPKQGCSWDSEHCVWLCL